MPNNLVLNEQIDYAELFTLWCEYWVVGSRYVLINFVVPTYIFHYDADQYLRYVWSYIWYDMKVYAVILIIRRPELNSLYRIDSIEKVLTEA